LRALERGEFELIASHALLEELGRALGYRKLRARIDDEEAVAVVRRRVRRRRWCRLRGRPHRCAPLIRATTTSSLSHRPTAPRWSSATSTCSTSRTTSRCSRSVTFSSCGWGGAVEPCLGRSPSDRGFRVSATARRPPRSGVRGRLHDSVRSGRAGVCPDRLIDRRVAGLIWIKVDGLIWIKADGLIWIKGRRALARLLPGLLVQPTLAEPAFTRELCHRGLPLAA